MKIFFDKSVLLKAMAFLFLLPLCTILYSQDAVDSLRQALKHDAQNPVLINNLAEALLPDSLEVVRAMAIHSIELAEKAENYFELGRSQFIIGDVGWYAQDFSEAAKWFGLSAASYQKAGDPLMAANGYNDMAFAWNQIDRYPEALAAYRKSMNILLSLDDEENLPSVLVNIGQVHQNLGQIDSAIFYNSQAAALSNIPGVEEAHSAALSNLGYIHKNMGDFDNALKYYNQAYDISKKMSDQIWMATDLNNIANVYSMWGKYDLAKSFLRQSISISKKINDRAGLEINLNNLAYIFQSCNDLDSAMMLYKQSAQIAKELGRTGNLGVRYINMGTTFLLMDNYDSAAYYVKRGLISSRKLGLKHSESGALQSLGMIMMAKKEYSKSKAYFDEALSLALDLDARLTLEKIYEGRSKLFEETGNYRLALENYQNFVAIKDSVFNAQSQNKLAEMQARHQTEKKQQQIELLIKDNKLQKTELRKKQITLLALGGGAIILAISALIIWLMYLQKARANRKLVEKTLEVVKHEEAEVVTIKSEEKHSRLPDDEKSRIIQELELQMRKQELFRQKQLSLADLAALIQTNTSYLSRLINEHYSINFSNFLNGWRVREAQKMFTKNQHQSMTLETIAEAVGFQSRSTFNTAFKKISGVTPSVFIKNMEEIIKSREAEV